MKKRNSSSGRGMPSAHGSEWKGQDAGEAKRRYDSEMDRIFGKPWYEGEDSVGSKESTDVR
jgi:hypothetical protein